MGATVWVMTHEPLPQRVAPRAALQYGDFRLFLTVRFFSNMAQLMQTVAVGWQVYDLTHRPLDLGYVGLVLFLPQILFSLVTGHVADRFDRRSVMLTCLSLEAVCAAGLLTLTHFGITSVMPIFVVLFLFGTSRAFLGPSMQSLVPLLVPKHHFPNAVAWSSSAWQVAVVAGPAVGGAIYGFGPDVVYATVTALLLVSVFATAFMATQLRPTESGGATLDRLLAGVRFVRAQPVVLGAISLDLFAVLFGGATALLPVYARDILHIGPWGLGLLRSAPAVGAALCGLWLAHHPLQKKAGVTMFACVAGFGAATVVFGLSTSFLLSAVALIAMGSFDMVSVYVRQSLVQLGTPDAMRGRVSAVSMVFVGASNELGEFESGMTAAWFGTVPAVVLGGIGTLVVVGLWAWRFKELREVDRLDRVHS